MLDMSMSDQTRTAIVTGASRGIGAAIANRLAADGLAVVVNYAHSADEAESVVSEIEAKGGVAKAVRADVSDPGDVASLFEQTSEAFGGIDVLINNAGIIQPGRVSIVDTDDELFTRLFDVNTRGVFNTLRAASSGLRDHGRIVNFSSSLVGLRLEGTAVYAGAKAAVETMTAIYAKELRGRGITVNAVAPGPTATELFLKGKSDDMIAQAKKAPPLERLGTPADIAGVVAFLVGPDGGWVNGQTIRANGGLV